jgi:hypothetical protein
MGHLPLVREKERTEPLRRMDEPLALASGDPRWANARDVGAREADVAMSVRRTFGSIGAHGDGDDAGGSDRMLHLPLSARRPCSR